MAPLKNILVATDFHEPSELALDYAIDLAQTLGASITLVHGWEIPVYSFPDGSIVGSAEVVNRIVTGAQEALRMSVERRKGRGVVITPLLIEGAPWRAIVDTAEANKVDLVVVGTHGRKGFAHALLGSVAEKVIRLSKRPVLVVPVTMGGAAAAPK